jgi:hypothetical protein
MIMSHQCNYYSDTFITHYITQDQYTRTSDSMCLNIWLQDSATSCKQPLGLCSVDAIRVLFVQCGTFLKSFSTTLMLTFSLKVEAYNAPANVHHLTSDKFTGVHQLFARVWLKKTLVQCIICQKDGR